MIQYTQSRFVATCRNFVALLSHCCRTQAKNRCFSSTFRIWHCHTRPAILPVLSLSIWLHEFIAGAGSAATETQRSVWRDIGSRQKREAT